MAPSQARAFPALSPAGRDCSYIWVQTPRAPSGVYTVQPEGASTPFEVSTPQGGPRGCCVCHLDQDKRWHCPPSWGKGQPGQVPLVESVLRHTRAHRCSQTLCYGQERLGGT